MFKFVFTLYNYTTKKFEEVYYSAETLGEALEKLVKDYNQNNYAIEEWVIL